MIYQPSVHQKKCKTDGMGLILLAKLSDFQNKNRLFSALLHILQNMPNFVRLFAGTANKNLTKRNYIYIQDEKRFQIKRLHSKR